MLDQITLSSLEIYILKLQAAIGFIKETWTTLWVLYIFLLGKLIWTIAKWYEKTFPL